MDEDEMESDDEEDNNTSAADNKSGKQMPVMWHQTLLTLVQCYRPYLTPASCLKLKALIKIHFHPQITPEIRKYLAADYLKNINSQSAAG